MIITLTSRTFSSSTPLPNLKPICLRSPFPAYIPRPWQPLTSFLALWICPIWTSHRCEILWCVVFCDCFIHSAYCFQGSSVICVLTHISTLFPFHSRIILCCMDPSHCIHPYGSGWTYWLFPRFGFFESAYEFSCGHVCSSILGVYPDRTGSAGSRGDLMFYLLRTWQAVSHSGWTTLRSGVLLRTPPHQFVLFVFLSVVILEGVRWHLPVCLICISSVMNNLSTFSCACWPFVYLAWWNVFSDLLLIFNCFLEGSFYYLVIIIL